MYKLVVSFKGENDWARNKEDNLKIERRNKGVCLPLSAKCMRDMREGCFTTSYML